MLLDINQLWPQDILAVQDTVQVHGSDQVHSIPLESPDLQPPSAAKTSLRETEQCLKSQMHEESMLNKTNHTDSEEPNESQPSENVRISHQP